MKLSREARQLSDAIRKAKEDSTIEEARKLVMKRLAEKRAEKERKAAERAAWLKEYHEQLAKGSSNMDKGSKKSRRSKARKLHPSPFHNPQ